jgi:hypothetical protein
LACWFDEAVKCGGSFGFGMGIADIFSELLNGGVGGCFDGTELERRSSTPWGGEGGRGLRFFGFGDGARILSCGIFSNPSGDARRGRMLAAPSCPLVFSNMEIKLPVGAMLSESTASALPKTLAAPKLIFLLGVLARGLGLTLLLAAKVAAIKLGLFGSNRGAEEGCNGAEGPLNWCSLAATTPMGYADESAWCRCR